MLTNLILDAIDNWLDRRFERRLIREQLQQSAQAAEKALSHTEKPTPTGILRHTLANVDPHTRATPKPTLRQRIRKYIDNYLLRWRNNRHVRRELRKLKRKIREGKLPKLPRRF